MSWFSEWFRRVTSTHSVDPLKVRAQVEAEFNADPINNDTLYYEWCNGPGKEYPHHTMMIRDIEGGPLRSVEVKDNGWEHEFRRWAAERTQLVGRKGAGDSKVT